MTSSLDRAARVAFAAEFGGLPTLRAQAPARVELLGNHTDYNGGLVLAAAIDRYTVVVGRPRGDRAIQAHSVSFASTERFDLDHLGPGAEGSWGRYVRGVLWALQEARGPLTTGFDAVIAGDVPLGAGLSSSASLQAAVALFALAVGSDSAIALDDDERRALARTLQRSENEFVGVASGLLDQFSVLFGRAGHALRLDCRDLSYERLPLGDPAPAIVVCDSKTSRRLADGMYNQRRAECERVVAHFNARWLRDVTLDQLDAARDDLDPVGRLRARHVLTENQRVALGAEALHRGDVAAFGRLMTASHASSRDDFGNSAPALDALVAAAERAPGFLGGKLSGAGWAGCTVNLVAAGAEEDFARAVVEHYARSTDVVPEIHICQAAAGAACQLLT